MEGLGHGHEVDRGVRQGRPLGGGHGVGDLVVGTGLGDLPLAGVGGDDGSEVGREGEGGLAVARGAVPGEVVRGAEGGQVLEEGRRVGRAEGPIPVGMAGEVVLEGHRSMPHEPA